MPSITYIEENGSGADRDRVEEPSNVKTPEPPSRYNADQPPMRSNGPMRIDEDSGIRSVRRLVTIAQIMALVSLLIGGVLLGSAALVTAVVAMRKTKAIPCAPDDYAWMALKRSAKIAIVIAVLALAANVAALVFIYPMVMDSIQSGEYSSLFSGAPQTQSPGSGTSTWG